jgi:hypothetical protein
MASLSHVSWWHFVNAIASDIHHHLDHASMADSYPDHDSAFGDDDFFWITNPMFSTPAVAGTKRAADDLTKAAAATSGPSAFEEHPNGTEHIDPSILCCDHCPEPCPERRAGRPTKRRASAQQVGAYHNLTADSHPIDADCQFPDDCFEKFCQECNLDAPPCPPDCSVPCPADTECSTPDACWDPHCDTKEKECADGCVDPDCTKLSCPDQTCFCQKCDVQPCPLGDPTNECHSAHTAPTTTGTIYCYDLVTFKRASMNRTVACPRLRRIPASPIRTRSVTVQTLRHRRRVHRHQSCRTATIPHSKVP